ncbi:GNAT family N-acetyltransferase [Pseudomonas sp. ANT_J12]|uniref:GNAT family N-acetyltransferase n=1 Tax=Pseudomonas sp. ANT_J12 TaxID=2597351 RepID=UPI0011F3E8D7|nr:GNAT family N-acetyltransferase [Pseudomonas sp. ANT_J12]KAA0987310.1 GNAT family N-acetyltransferase [Pseudomonas sp. ANT_J12]
MLTDYAVEKILAALGHASPDEHWIEALNNGAHVLIRPLHEQDRQLEFEFINQMSAESFRTRFFGAMGHENVSLLDQMMDVDYRNRMAYIAMVHENGHLIEVGISRYADSADVQQCECAVVVADRWQRQGIGTLLMEHLIVAAQRNGFKKMMSIHQTNNFGMHRLARSLGFHSRYPATGDNEIIHELDLTPAFG